MLLGFKKQFVTKILDGSKKFTIRNVRKVEPKIGDQLHMYTGLRTKYCEKISSEHTLKGIQLVDIFIQRRANPTIITDSAIKLQQYYTIDIKVDNWILTDSEILNFVISDGFESEIQFADYWIKEAGEVTKQFREGVKEPIMILSYVSEFGLIMYHWTDLRF